MHITSFSSSNNNQKVQIVSLLANKTLVTISSEYSEFADVIFPESSTELSKYIDINNHTKNLVKGQQFPYGPIYNLRLVKLEILKTYIETNLINSFICPFKSPTSALILFV